MILIWQIDLHWILIFFLKWSAFNAFIPLDVITPDLGFGSAEKTMAKIKH